MFSPQLDSSDYSRILFERFVQIDVVALEAGALVGSVANAPRIRSSRRMYGRSTQAGYLFCDRCNCTCKLSCERAQ